MTSDRRNGSGLWQEKEDLPQSIPGKLDPGNFSKRFIQNDAGLTKPYQVFDWLIYHLRKRFGNESVKFVAHEFGYNVSIQISVKRKDGKFDIASFVVRRVECRHYFFFPGEEGYGEECEKNLGSHSIYDIRVVADKMGRPTYLKGLESQLRDRFKEQAKRATA